MEVEPCFISQKANIDDTINKVVQYTAQIFFLPPCQAREIKLYTDHSLTGKVNNSNTKGNTDL